MSRSSVYLQNLGLIKQIMLNSDENKLSLIFFSSSSQGLSSF